MTARAGTQFGCYFGAEVEAGIGLNEQTVEYGSYDIDTRLKYSAGAFLTAEYPVSDKITVVGRLGYSKTELEASYGGYSRPTALTARPAGSA